MVLNLRNRQILATIKSHKVNNNVMYRVTNYLHNYTSCQLLDGINYQKIFYALQSVSGDRRRMVYGLIKHAVKGWALQVVNPFTELFKFKT